MNKRILLTGLVIIFAISFVALLRLSQNNEVAITLKNQTTPQNTLPPSALATATSTPSSTPSASVTFAHHNTTQDCWILYQNKIYDITSFLPRHPGGVQKIAQFCGTTGFEQAFTQKHGTSKVSALMKVGVFIGDFDIKGSAE